MCVCKLCIGQYVAIYDYMHKSTIWQLFCQTNESAQNILPTYSCRLKYFVNNYNCTLKLCNLFTHQHVMFVSMWSKVQFHTLLTSFTEYLDILFYDLTNKGSNTPICDFPYS